MKKKSFNYSCPMPEFDFDFVTLGHGSGGQLTNSLLEKVVFPLFSQDADTARHDGAVFTAHGKLAFSTDSFVVSPVFFPGGNIGDLAVNGTMNDLAMCGAVPKYLSLSLIIEEGLKFEDLWKMLISVQEICDKYNVKVVTGDTKVVERGKGDKIFINTSGIGEVKEKAQIDVRNIKSGDHVLVSGNIGTHGMAVMSVREGLEFESDLISDTVYVGELSGKLIDEFGSKIRFLRDPTRGGLATTLCEAAVEINKSVEIKESLIPVLTQTKSACELLGLDPVYAANEGVFIVVTDPDISDKAIRMMQKHSVGKSAAYIGKITENYPGKVIMTSGIGGRRVLTSLTGEQLPRIC
jgi:hydrogenase expression/formation protein HypE